MVLIEVIQKEREKRSWEEYLSLGMEAREQKDSASWLLGDLAQEVGKDYGSDSLGKYAYAVSIPKKTLMNYRTIAGFYELEVREKYRKLSFSHFACLTATEKPEAWLKKADTEEWSVETLRKKVKEAYEKMKEPKLDDKPPIAYRCPICGQWRLKDTSSLEICRGHYEIKKGKTVYR